MIASFFHDVPFAFFEGRPYSIGFSQRLWQRYLNCFDMIIICTRCNYVSEKSNVETMLLSDGPDVVYMPATAYKKPSDFFIRNSEIVSQVDAALAKSDAAIIRLPSILGLIAFLRAKKNHKPIVIEVVACAWDSYWNMGGVLGKIAALPLFLLNKKAIYEADHVLYVTKSFLQRRYPTKGYFAGVSDVCINEPDEKVLASRLKHISTRFMRPPIFGIIGSLNIEYKGHRIAFKALASIKEEIPGFELHCLGGGDPHKWQILAMRYGIGKNVFFDGTLPAGDAVNKWIDGIDVLLVPSLQEGLPRALIEAMSRGCPALGAHTGGIPELLGNDYLHKPRDSKKLGEQIVNLIRNEQLLARVADENFAKAKEYSPELLEGKRKEFWNHYTM